MELDCKQTVSEVQKSNIENPSAVEASSTRALANSDITLLHPNEVPQVINEAPAVSDDDDYE